MLLRPFIASTSCILTANVNNIRAVKRFDMRVLAIGDNCIDDYTELGKRFPGGNALNVAVYSSRYTGVQSDYVGIIGTDDCGDYMLEQIQKNGLSTEYIIREPGLTAVTKILIRNGDRVFADYIEGVQKDAQLPYDKIPNPDNYDLLHFTVWGFGRENVKKLSETSKALLSCDFSNQLEDQRTEILPYLDLAFFSGSHLIKKGVDLDLVLRKLKEKTMGTVVMTLGEYGSMVCDGEMIYRGKALPVDVVDTLGAGDSYIAAFLCRKLQGKSIQESIEEGHRAATETCKRLGGWGGEP
ncbi:fructoselysine 6-kinase [Candidatus Bathyarchaeota archaeon]|nr:fructoselysine 6-kinase [Candidatus Bathyarchaeota archaeon]